MFVNTDQYTKYIRLWLITMIILIVSIVGVGGLTRLTDSGLSITAWELFSGIFPPFNIEKWNFYFDEYKKIPEYKILNFNMTLEEFKVIFYWEWGHRILARIIGLMSIIPLIIIFLRFKKNLFFEKKYYLVFLLVCFQGFIGWFMVSSGLVENTDVSHYRLASHLSIAFLILSLVFWFLLQNLEIKKNTQKINFFFLSVFLFFLIIQIILGAFLAGLDGGLIYNTWPDMNGQFIPSDIDKTDLIKISSSNDPTVIQFYHRFIAYIIILFLVTLNYFHYTKGIDFNNITVLNIAVAIQIILGIITLVTGVEIKYASIHQLGSILVLLSFLFIYYKNTN
ncbi:COX15/CtaA family protein [Candidatus Pelagibacter sp.]|uniref:COX15/CtaA family protein n=1 Tax=Candidatus Pelagibacter sp. TaxID=2024849 RepID=UPI003F8587D2